MKTITFVSDKETARATSVRWKKKLALCSALLLLAGCRRSAERTAACCDTNEPAAPATAQWEAASTNGDAADLFSSDWTEPAKRPALNLVHQATRHDGAAVGLRDMVGQPLAISFAYTRCSNPNKCRLVTTTSRCARAFRRPACSTR